MPAHPSLVAPEAIGVTPLRGIAAAAVTPVLPDLAIDVPRLRDHLAWLLANGCDMVSVFGTTGEGVSLPVEAKCSALRQLVSSGISPGRLLPAVMASSALDARRMVDAAAELECRAVLLLPPFYYPPDGRGVAAFVAAVMGARPAIDLLLYHIPAMSRFEFSMDLIAKLQDRYGPRLAGIKDSAGDLAHTLALAQRFPEIAIFTGTDRDLLPLLAAGGAGIIGGMPNVNARALRQLLDASLEKRAALEARIGTLLDAVVAYGGPMPIKTLVAHQHNDDAWLRAVPPLAPQAGAERSALIDCFLSAGFAFETGRI